MTFEFAPNMMNVKVHPHYPFKDIFESPNDTLIPILLSYLSFI